MAKAHAARWSRLSLLNIWSHIAADSSVLAAAAGAVPTFLGSLPFWAARGEWQNAARQDMGAATIRAKRDRLAVSALLAAGLTAARAFLGLGGRTAECSSDAGRARRQQLKAGERASRPASARWAGY